MAVHMIRVVTGLGGDYSLSELNTELDDWVSKQSEWTADPNSHQVREPIDPETGSPIGYRIGDYRFLLQDAKDNLLTKCEDKLVNKTDWYRIGYHTCSHDEETRTSCDWDDQREWTAKDVSIPDNVPVFVEATQ